MDPRLPINEALETFFLDKDNEEENTTDSYEIGKPYFGNYGSGNGSLSTDYKNILRGKVHARIYAD
jgi:hypothetical protein